MADRDYKITDSGIMNGGTSSDAVNIPTGTGVLSTYINAAIMFEVTLVIFATATNVITTKQLFYAKVVGGAWTVGGLSNIFEAGDAGAGPGGTTLSFTTASFTGSDIRFAFGTTTSATTRYWRTFITAYIKENS